MTMDRLEGQIAMLAGCSPAELRAEWQATFGEAAPALPLSILRRAISYRLQEKALGGLPAATERMLDAIARDPAATAPDPPVRVKPGTRLLREWGGKVHTVLVTDDGILFEDQRFASLSHVARAITGARWSGPRFFGLRRPALPPSQRRTARS